MTNQAAQTMPELPDPAFVTPDDNLYTVHQMRAMYQQGYAAALSQTAGVPEGCVLVPARMELTPENMEALALMLGGDPDAKDSDERWNGGTLWVGETIGDNGEKYYGLNVANVECYEEGSIPIVEFAAAPAASGVHPDALPDGTLSKSTAKRVEALAAASVSERARDDLHVAICQAVALMNMEPMTTSGLLQAHDILRKAIS